MGWKESLYSPVRISSYANNSIIKSYHWKTNTILVHYTNKISQPVYKPIVYVNVLANPNKYVYGSRTTKTNWFMECSTNTAPDQSYYSMNYTNVECTNPKWIRWRRDYMIDSGGNFSYKVRKIR